MDGTTIPQNYSYYLASSEGCHSPQVTILLLFDKLPFKTLNFGIKLVYKRQNVHREEIQSWHFTPIKG